MRKKALVVGAGGQDGHYLFEKLTVRGYEVWRLCRKGLWGPQDSLLESFNLSDGEAWIGLMGKGRFDEVYYLAAYHHAAEDRHKAVGLEEWRNSCVVHVEGWIACLEALRQKRPACRAFYAASSLVFGHPEKSPQDEQTPFRPDTIYGITKAAGVSASLHYRKQHGLHVSAGILYNHESTRRPERFVTQKIIQGLVRVKKQFQKTISLARLDAVVDWGYAPDYVVAMHKILLQETPGDYIIATGQAHTVADFVSEVCYLLGLDMHAVVREEAQSTDCRCSTVPLVGNPSKLRGATGWSPSIGFKEMIQKLVSAAL